MELKIVCIYQLSYHKTITVSESEDHWSYIAHLNAEDMFKSAVIEEKKFKNIESEIFCCFTYKHSGPS